MPYNEQPSRTTAEVDPIPSKSSDWETWYHVVTRLATNLDCWSYIDPDNENPTLLDEPDRPDPADYGSIDGTITAIPRAQDGASYMDANRLYMDELEKYHNRRKAIAEVDKYINTHTDRSLILLFKKRRLFTSHLYCSRIFSLPRISISEAELRYSIYLSNSD